jgi:uridine kinase
MNLLFRQPLFLIGLALRVALIILIAPKPVLEWYVPFLEHSLSWSVNPWGDWLNGGGVQAAFPYGYVMWLAFLPLAFVAKLIGLSLAYGYALTLLGADILLLLLLRQMYPKRDRLLFGIYWLSPIVIFATYGLGYNDLIPVLFLTLAYFFIRDLRFKLSGMSMALAISAKLSMALALPFFLVYFLRNRPLRHFLGEFLTGLAVGALLFLVPFAASGSAMQMLFGNPEMGKVYELRLGLGSGIAIYLVPVVYFWVLYAAWRVRRLNHELFNALSGIAFLAIVLMTPASPGWFIWVVPLLVAYQFMSDRVSIGLVGAFSVLYVFSSLTQLLPADGLGLLMIQENGELSRHFQSLIHTMMVIVGLILTIRLWREAVSRNDYFRLSRKPFVLGIAGDSGSGKDTFATAVEGLFGKHSVTKISGDDYHLWDRQKPMWQVMTHLNPMANDLAAFARDILALVDGKPIHARHYDHKTGRMSHLQRIESNDLIIASGLHALYLPMLRGAYDLSVYLDIDEGLRKHFKITRDINHRGHSLEKAEVSLRRREADSTKFVRPQAAFADLTLSLRPIHPRLLEGEDVADKLRYKITARSRHGFNEQALTRALVGVCGLHVDMIYSEDASEVELTIEGETFAEDVALAARMVCPQIFEFLNIYPQWRDGVTGLMQLITISHINQALTKRFL